MSLIQCHYDYGCCIRYKGLNKVLKPKLQTTQNKLTRFVLDLESRAQLSKEHFNLLNWLPVNSRVDHLTLCHVVFKMKNGLSPQYMREHFFPQDGVHTYNTRLSSKGAFVIPKVKVTWSKSFCYNWCLLWNSSPHIFSEISQISQFFYQLWFICLHSTHLLTILTHNSVYLSVTCNTIQSIVISTEYFYISFTYIIFTSLCHATTQRTITEISVYPFICHPWC